MVDVINYFSISLNLKFIIAIPKLIIHHQAQFLSLVIHDIAPKIRAHSYQNSPIPIDSLSGTGSPYALVLLTTMSS